MVNIKKGPGAFQVLFVCTGNMCRSAMAEGVLRHKLAKQGVSGITVSSAGISAHEGGPASREAVQVAAENGVDLSPHRARYLTRAITGQADLILVMTTEHYYWVLDLDQESLFKTYFLREFGRAKDVPADKEIADPMGGGPMLYRQTYAEIEREIERLLPALKRLAGKKQR